MSVLLCHVPENDTVSRKALSEIYSARHREMWNAIPSVVLRGSKTTFDAKIGKYDAVFPNGEKISQYLSLYPFGNERKACIQMQFDITDDRFKLLNFDQYSQRISDIIKVNIQRYPDARIDIGFLPDNTYQQSQAHPSKDAPPQPPQDTRAATIEKLRQSQARLAQVNSELNDTTTKALNMLAERDAMKNKLLAKKNRGGLTTQEQTALDELLKWIHHMEDVLNS